MKRFFCKIFGHGESRLLDEHSRTGERTKTVILIAQRFISIPPTRFAKITGKWRCARCGAIHLSTEDVQVGETGKALRF